MAELVFKYKGVVFTVKDIGGKDDERLVFTPDTNAQNLGLDVLYIEFEHKLERSFEIDGKYWQSIDPTDNWSRRIDFAKSIGAKILKYTGVKYPEDAIF